VKRYKSRGAEEGQANRSSSDGRKTVRVDFSEDWEDVMYEKFEELAVDRDMYTMKCYDCRSKLIDLDADVVEIVRDSFPLQFVFERN